MGHTDSYDFHQICPVDDLPSGERILFEIEGFSIALFRVGEKYYAIGDVCTHDNGPIGDGELDGLEVVCPRHGARFDLETGNATRLPAVRGIPVYPVRVRENLIEVGIPIRIAR